MLLTGFNPKSKVFLVIIINYLENILKSIKFKDLSGVVYDKAKLGSYWSDCIGYSCCWMHLYMSVDWI